MQGELLSLGQVYPRCQEQGGGGGGGEVFQGTIDPHRVYARAF